MTTLAEDIRTIKEWATEAVNDWAQGADEAEVLSDCAQAFIDSEVETQVRARQIRRHFFGNDY